MTSKLGSGGPLYKTVLVGDAGVGKTSLITFITKGYFMINPTPTIGASFFRYQQNERMAEGPLNHAATLEVWDTAGNRQYKSLIPSYLRGSDVILLIYDVTNPGSYKDLANWDELLTRSIPEDRQPIKMLIANKIDAMTTWDGFAPREADEHFALWNLGQRFAAERDYLFASTSAKTGYGVFNCLNTAIEAVDARAAYIHAPLPEEPEPRTVILSPPSTFSPCSC